MWEFKHKNRSLAAVHRSSSTGEQIVRGALTYARVLRDMQHWIYEQFSRTDFNVERFIHLARRRASLQQIHNDLRVYLKIVQNSMIELINDDYTDFVNLSSNLVGLKETIDKLTKNIETVWHDFCSSTQSVKQSAEFVEQTTTDLIKCREAQCEIRGQIFLIKSIERLADKISSCPEELEQFWLRSFADAFVNMVLWFGKVKITDDKVAAAYAMCLTYVRKLTEHWLVQDLRGDCRFIEQVLGIITLNSGTDSAVSRVMTEVISEHLGEPNNNLGDFLDEVYRTIRKLREDWLQKVASNGMSSPSISHFLDKCLLTFIISFLDQHFGSVVVPSDNRLFHRCYKTTCDFISNWPDAASSCTVLRMIRNKFSLVVYFKLETQHFLTQLKDELDPSILKLLTSEKKEEWEEKIFYYFSKLVINTLERIWSDEVYLPTLIDRSWDFTLKVLCMYLEWIEGIKSYYWIDRKAPEDFEVWRMFCALYTDCLTVDSRIFGIALSSIWPKIREHELDVTVFGQCLSTFSNKIAERMREFEKFIIGDAVTSLAKILDGVCGIPRQYRWTKKPIPTEISPYVSETSAALKLIRDEMEHCCWDDENSAAVFKEISAELLKIFSLKAKEVLESVEQTETSLQRFKRKSLSVNENNVDSDENKIRRQLLLDLDYFKAWAVSCNIEISHVESLMLRANLPTETLQMPNLIRSVPNTTSIVEERQEEISLQKMSATWADIQRLAADFQRLQLAECSKRLSENNCVELISMLIKSKAIDIVFTSDGKEYVTRKHLLTEVKNECIGQEGRISLSGLVHALNVDYEHIENAVSVITRQSPAFILCNAELISRDYIDILCKELNEQLMDFGVVFISQLTKIWDLPTEVLTDLVLVELGSKIDAVRDGDALYTPSYLSGQQNIIKAMLCGLTKVTPIAKLQAELGLTNAMFWSLFEELVVMGEVPGKIIGNRASSHCLYHPNIYTILVRQYIVKTFLQEGMLELSMFRKFSVAEPKIYLKEVLENAEYSTLMYFPSAIISKKVWNEVEATVKEKMNSKLIVDVRQCVPEIVRSNADIEQAIFFLVKGSEDWLFVLGTSYIYSRQFLSFVLRDLEGLINARAEEIASNWGKQKAQAPKKQEKKQDDEWGTAKSKKGKGGKGKKQILAEESAEELPVRLSEEELIRELEKMNNIPTELLEDVVYQVQTKAEALLRARLQVLLNNVRMISVQDQKRAHAQLQETLSTLYNNICIFEDGAATFEDTVAANLKIHLLRTLCTHFANIVLSYVSRTQNVDTLTVKVRNETIANIESVDNRMAVEKLFTALSSKDLQSFHHAVFGICSSAVCALNLKFPDKKQRADLVKTYEDELVIQLRDCTDPPSGLLLSLLILLARNEKIAVHASGKFVSHLISKVENHPETTAPLVELLTSSQKAVIASMQSKGDLNLMAKLDEKMIALKAMINGFEYVEKSLVGEGVFEF
uniref:Conserved oligomeric Golgi complex subunit 2 n=1 Tax=Setaria digitata TaxID=48799 RepID=A0A915PJ19_9BILA